MCKILDDIRPLDWEGDFQSAALTSQEALSWLASNPREIQTLLLAVAENSRLLEQCETLALDDKVVLYDALDSKGFILRLHLSKNERKEVAHDHRFSLSVYILRGIYFHKLYRARCAPEEIRGEDDLRVLLVREEIRGSCYTLHHSVIESNTTVPGTLSLLMRGPPMKRRAIGIDRGSERLFHKYGKDDESEQHRRDVQMTTEHLRRLTTRVDELMGWGPV